jgi:hypothetical protein
LRFATDADESPPALLDADALAYEEAVQGGGVCYAGLKHVAYELIVHIHLQLLLYWCGFPHPDTRRNLATCIWESRALAAATMSRPQHINAMRLAAASYESYEIKRWTLRKTAGSTRLEILPYDGSAAGL